jgi:hypothetical protein
LPRHLRLILNDAVKVAMIKWRVPSAVAKKRVNITPQIVKCADELYQQRGQQDRRAVQDWEQAEREIRKDETPKEAETTYSAGAAERMKMNSKRAVRRERPQVQPSMLSDGLRVANRWSLFLRRLPTWRRARFH